MIISAHPGPARRSRLPKSIRILSILLGTGVLVQSAASQSAPASPIVRALELEMKRSVELLKQKGDPAPYFISYSVRESKTVDIDASLGALRTTRTDHARLLDVE